MVTALLVTLGVGVHLHAFVADRHENMVILAVGSHGMSRMIGRGRRSNQTDRQSGEQTPGVHGTDHGHADAIQTAAEVDPFVTAVEPDLVASDAGNSVHNCPGSYVEDVAATGH